MRVRFLKDWTYKYKGPESGPWMKDYKAGQDVRLPKEQYTQARAAGVVEEVRKNGDQIREPNEDHKSVAETDAGDAAAD